MKPTLISTKPQLTVFSSICSDLVAFWLATTFTTKDAFTLINNLIFATIFLLLAVKANELAEKI